MNHPPREDSMQPFVSFPSLTERRSDKITSSNPSNTLNFYRSSDKAGKRSATDAMDAIPPMISSSRRSSSSRRNCLGVPSETGALLSRVRTRCERVPLLPKSST